LQLPGVLLEFRLAVDETGWLESPGMSSLAKMKCVGCSGDVPPLTADEIAPLAKQLPGWEVVDHHHLHRKRATEEFVDALKLANKIGAVAEKAGHHPDLLVAYGRLEITIFTHKIDGLTKSDFILAAKIDEVLASRKKSKGRKRT
jgi:4a-hydroxytetrahydrobiopterin dehydratase